MAPIKHSLDTAYDAELTVGFKAETPAKKSRQDVRMPSHKLALPLDGCQTLNDSSQVEFEKRKISPEVDRMASLFISSYNKRRPIKTQRGRQGLARHGVDMRIQDRAERYELRAGPFSITRTDTVREYFCEMSLDGVDYKLGDGLRFEDRHGKEHLAILSQIYEKSSLNAADQVRVPRAHVELLIEHKYGWPDELFVQHGSCKTIQLQQIRGRFSLSDARPKDFAATSGPHCTLVHVPGTDAFVHRVPGCSTCNLPRDDLTHRPPAAIHLHDTVAVDTGTSHACLRIGWVEGFNGDQLKVRWYGRMSELEGGEHAFVDPWALYLTDDRATIARYSIVDIVIVRSSPPLEYEHHPAGILHCSARLPCGRPANRRSLIPLERPLSTCIACVSSISRREQDLHAFREMGGLPSADLYAGGGGTMIGKRGWFRSKLAVDLDETACATLEHNFPDTKIVCQTIQRLHFAALHRDSAGTHQRIVDRRDRGLPEDQLRLVEAFPVKGTFALLSASPPCQGFSGKNRFKNPEDLRNEEVIVVLAEVDRSRPDWVLIENVPGMLQARKDGALMVEDGGSFADFVNRMLIGLGNQVAAIKLDAASYGSPSIRQRVFYLGARKGIPMPRWPAPTHVNARYQAPGLTEASRNIFGRSPGAALLPGWNARHAFSDLLPFDYDIPSFRSRAVAPEPRKGFVSPVGYAKAPRTAYEAIKRGEEEIIWNHCTPTTSTGHIAIIRDLVQAGQDAFLVPKDEDGKPTNAPYRANPDASMKTLLTSPTGACVHWSNRFFTVAERARAQGFPDGYRLMGDLQEKNKQIGNAVNPDMASAIFRQIVLDCVLPVWIEMGRPGADRFDRMWREKYPV